MESTLGHQHEQVSELLDKPSISPPLKGHEGDNFTDILLQCQALSRSLDRTFVLLELRNA